LDEKEKRVGQMEEGMKRLREEQEKDMNQVKEVNSGGGGGGSGVGGIERKCCNITYHETAQQPLQLLL